MSRERALKVLLVLVGLIFLVGVYPLMMFLWPSGWRWQPNQPEYEQMILGVYADTCDSSCCCIPQPIGESQSDCLYCLVEPRSCRDYGNTGVPECERTWTPDPLHTALIIVGIALIVLAPAKQSG